MKKNFKIKLIILFMLAFVFSQNVQAASLNLITEKNTFKEDELFVVTLSLSTEGEMVNAVEGDLMYNSDFIKAESVNIGGSFINLWIEKPNVEIPGMIHFSGITPGGVAGENGEVLKVIFKTQKIGDTSLSLDRVSLLLNDGKGSTTPAKVKDISLKITQGISSEIIPDTISLDKIPPEKFTITRTKDKSIFENSYFIAFSALDKESGVDHFKVCELFKCVVGESPFLLWNQTPFYYIAVSVYDVNGNSSVSTLISPYFAILFGLILFGALALLFRRYLRSNRV